MKHDEETNKLSHAAPNTNYVPVKCIRTIFTVIVTKIELRLMGTVGTSKPSKDSKFNSSRMDIYKTLVSHLQIHVTPSRRVRNCLCNCVIEKPMSHLIIIIENG